MYVVCALSRPAIVVVDLFFGACAYGNVLNGTMIPANLQLQQIDGIEER